MRENQCWDVWTGSGSQDTCSHPIRGTSAMMSTCESPAAIKSTSVSLNVGARAALLQRR